MITSYCMLLSSFSLCYHSVFWFWLYLQAQPYGLSFIMLKLFSYACYYIWGKRCLSELFKVRLVPKQIIWHSKVSEQNWRANQILMLVKSRFSPIIVNSSMWDAHDSYTLTFKIKIKLETMKKKRRGQLKKGKKYPLFLSPFFPSPFQIWSNLDTEI